MPPVIIAAAAVAGAAAGYVSWGAALAVVVNVAIGALTKPKDQSAAGGAAAAALAKRSQTVRSSIESRKIILGECMVGGPMIYAGSSGADDEYIHIVIPLAGHECEAIGDVWFGDKLASDYDPAFYRIKKHLGAADQVADADLVAEVPEWTTAHRCQGCAYIYVRFKFSQEVFPTGLPSVRALVKGAKVYDPRYETTYWSDNWALCTRYYLRDCALGLQCDADEIDEVEAAASASICDESVATPEGGTQSRYTCNGVIDSALRPRDVMDSIKSAGAGEIVHSQGVYKIIAGAYRAPVQDINESDLRGDVKIRLQPPKRDIFNTVRGLYISPLNFYEPTDFPIVKSQTYIDQDAGEEIVKDIVLDFTDDSTMAQRLAQIDLRKAREATIIEWPGTYTMLDRSPQDTVRVSLDSMGWVNEEFVIVDRTLAAEGGIDFVLQKTSSAIWSWQGVDAVAIEQSLDTSLVSALTCPPPTSPLFTEQLFALEGSGSLSWTAAPSAFVTEYKVQFRPVELTAWTDVPGLIRGTDCPIRNLAPGLYDFRVQAVNTIGTPSSWAYTVGEITVASVMPRVSGLELFGQGNNAEFVGKHARFAWRESSLTKAYDLGDEPYGADSGARDLYFKDFEVRVLDSNGALLRTEHVLDNFYTYTYEKNVQDYVEQNGVSGANRTFTLEVYQRGRENQISEKPASLTVTNPAPGLPSGIGVRAAFRTLFVTYIAPTDLDWQGVRIWLGTSPGFTPGPSSLVYDGPDTLVVIDAIADGTQLDSGANYYAVMQAYDGFGPEGAPSVEFLASTVFINGEFDIEEYSIGHAQIGLLEVWDANILSCKIDKLESGEIVSKYVSIGSNGSIRSGQTAWNTGTGWWLGKVGDYAKFSLGSSAGSYVTWSQETGILNIKGTIAITGTSTGYGNLTDAPSDLATLDPTQDNKLDGIAAGATVGATWGSNLSSIPARFADTPSSAGLYMTATYLGYYNGSWRSYFDNTGKFYFSGGTGQYLAFDGNDLEFSGTLNVKSAASGNRMEIKNSTIKVINSAGVALVHIGDLDA